MVWPAQKVTEMPTEKEVLDGAVWRLAEPFDRHPCGLIPNPSPAGGDLSLLGPFPCWPCSTDEVTQGNWQVRIFIPFAQGI